MTPSSATSPHGMGFALAFLFYLASVGFGAALAGSVVEEKQSRIVEIIATKIPVRQLLAGKVLGNTALAVLQMALYGVIGVVGLSFTSYGALLPTVTGALGWFLVFFLVGFLVIACLWAVAGALASRNEDLQSTSMPITMVLLGIFFGSLFLDGTAQTVFSYVPPASAVLMPLRVLDGSAAWWEPFVSLGDPARVRRRGGARGRAALPALPAADPGPDLDASGVVRAGVRARGTDPA